jgi:hypothetical protein
MLERLDQSARHVLERARSEAAALADHAVGTEHLLLALAAADPVTAGILAEAGAGEADVRRVMAAPRSRRHGERRDHDVLLAALGIDLTEVRRRAERTFGDDAVARAALQARPRRGRRPLWTWISCSRPHPSRRCDSPLTGQSLHLIPRVKRLLDRATRAARPGLASPSHLLLALITGEEPACEVLAELGVDLDAVAATARRWLDDAGTGGERRT